MKVSKYWQSTEVILEVFQIRSGTWHHSKCHTPSGLVLCHLTMGFFFFFTSPSMVQSITNAENKKGRRTSPALSHRKRGGVSSWLRTVCGKVHCYGFNKTVFLSISLHFPSCIFPSRKTKTLQHCTGSVQLPSPWQKWDRYRNVPSSHY